MDIIFQGQHDSGQAGESLLGVIQLLKDRYRIGTFREMHLTVTLVDEVGADVELVDSETNQPYRVLEVSRERVEPARRVGRPALKLVIDNTP